MDIPVTLLKSKQHIRTVNIINIIIKYYKWPYLDLLSIRWLFKTNFLPHGKSAVAGSLEPSSTSCKERDRGHHAICNPMLAERDVQTKTYLKGISLN